MLNVFTGLDKIITNENNKLCIIVFCRALR